MHYEKRQSTDFGHRLRIAREREGLTQVALANQVGIHQSTLSRIEKGQEPRSEKKQRLSNYIDQQEALIETPLERLLEMVRRSPELRALVAKIHAGK